MFKDKQSAFSMLRNVFFCDLPNTALHILVYQQNILISTANQVLKTFKEILVFNSFNSISLLPPCTEDIKLIL